MRIFVRIVDENGLFIEDAFVDEQPVLTEIITEEIEHVSYSETGEELITIETVERTVAITDENGNAIPDPHYISEPVPQGFYHPKWDGTEWVEGLTEGEITELTKPVLQEPTEMDYLMLTMAELDMQRAVDKTETELAITELAEFVLMGGM